MNEIHEANRRRWDEMAGDWEERLNRDGLWRRCQFEPGLAFEGGALETIREMIGTFGGKRVCVIGSGDNLAAYALASLGARVTSTDISEERLRLAADRADALGLSIEFVRSDAASLDSLSDSSFDLVCSTNGFFVWVADLYGVFSEVARILKSGGAYVFYDVHPFTRPWKEQVAPVEMTKTYWDSGPFHGSEEDSYEHHWTLADLLNPLAQAGLVLMRVIESPARDSTYWQGGNGAAGTDDALLDWRANPRAGLPAWLTVAASAP